MEAVACATNLLMCEFSTEPCGPQSMVDVLYWKFTAQCPTAHRAAAASWCSSMRKVKDPLSWLATFLSHPVAQELQAMLRKDAQSATTVGDLCIALMLGPLQRYQLYLVDISGAVYRILRSGAEQFLEDVVAHAVVEGAASDASKVFHALVLMSCVDVGVSVPCILARTRLRDVDGTGPAALLAVLAFVLEPFALVWTMPALADASAEEVRRVVQKFKEAVPPQGFELQHACLASVLTSFPAAGP